MSGPPPRHASVSGGSSLAPGRAPSPSPGQASTRRQPWPRAAPGCRRRRGSPPAGTAGRPCPSRCWLPRVVVAPEQLEGQHDDDQQDHGDLHGTPGRHARPRSSPGWPRPRGSVGPSPYAGHQRATGQAPQAGLRAWQTRRPCQIRWWLSIVQSRLGNSAPTACSTLTGSVSSVQPKRRASRPKCVSTVSPGIAEGVAEHDVGGLAAHAGQGDEVLEPRRDLAVEALDERLRELEQRLGLGAEEAGRLDDRLDPLAVPAGHRAWRRGRPRTASGSPR